MCKNLIMISRFFQAVSAANRFSLLHSIEHGAYDCANILGSIKPPSSLHTEDLLTKFSLLSPSYLYNTLDIFSRDVLLYLANDMGWGMGMGIFAISVGIKIFFAPIMLKAQLNAVRMKLIEPEMKNYQNLIQRLMRAQDMQGVRQAQKQFKVFKKKHNVSMVIPMLSITQVPFLITWFLSLRYILYLPEEYQGLSTQGFLWFKNLSENDPYGILPILSACFTFYGISLNPNMSTSTTIPFAKYTRYIRFLPFFSIPIVVFFPAGLNLYWCTSAFCQMLITAMARSESIRKLMGVPKYLPGTVLERQHLAAVTHVIKAHIEDQPDKGGQFIKLSQVKEMSEPYTQHKVIEQNTSKSKESVKIFSQKPKKKI